MFSNTGRICVHPPVRQNRLVPDYSRFLRMRSVDVARGPVRQTDRIEWLDLLRGFAVFGILFANILVFALPQDAGNWPGLFDKAAKFGINTFVSGKFINLFTILFGVSFALQISRLRRSPGDARRIFLRRQAGLFLLGVIHVLLFSSQDILVFYAILGLVLWPLRNLRTKALLTIAAIVYVLSFVPAQLDRLHTIVGKETVSATSSGVVAQSGNPIGRLANPYAGDNWLSIADYRVREFLHGPTTTVVRYLRKLPFFLLGIALIKSRWLMAFAADRRRLVRATAMAATIGLTGRFLLYLTYLGSAPEWTLFWRLPIAAIADPALTIAYSALLIYLFQFTRCRRYFSPLVATGRVALSNYVLQSVIATTLFYGYGFGLYGKIGPFGLVLTSLAILGALAAMSVAWLRVYRFGPLEWIWRSMTYGQWQPIRHR